MLASPPESRPSRARLQTGAGTAAVITPICRIAHEDTVIDLDIDAPDLTSKQLYSTIVDIQTGAAEDAHGWNRDVGSAMEPDRTMTGS